MKTLPLALVLSLFLALLAGCGGDDVADDPKLSEEGKTMVTELGGPFSADEFDRFLKDLPEIPALTNFSQEGITQTSGMALRAAVKDAVEERGWDEERFMYIYGHTMHMMSLEQMDRMEQEMAAQLDGMPEEQRKMMEQMMGGQITAQKEAMQAEVDKQIPTSEQSIIADRMDDIHKAFGIE